MRKFIVLFSGIIFILPIYLLAAVRIGIDGGNVKLTNIALSNFIYSNKSDNSIKDDSKDDKLKAESSKEKQNISQDNTSDNFAQIIHDIIANNIEICGSFNLYNQQYAKDKEVLWQRLGIPFAINGNVELVNKKIKFNFVIWDTFGKNKILEKTYIFYKKDLRRVAHTASNDIYMRIFGIKGNFNSRIAYVAKNYQTNKKRIIISDYDGFNPLYIDDKDNDLMSPRFSYDLKKLVYTKYIDNNPLIMIRDLKTKIEKRLLKTNDISLSPRFSPNNKFITFSLLEDSGSNIYLYNLKTSRKKKITNNNYINISPAWSSDSKKIVFNSDRDGSSQLYVMDYNGSNIKRISSSYGTYYTPSWSPDGQWIVFTNIYDGSFCLGIMRPDGQDEKIINCSYFIDSPSWSPNSKSIIYTKKKSSIAPEKIFIVDIIGYYNREFLKSNNTEDPFWSNYIN